MREDETGPAAAAAPTGPRRRELLAATVAGLVAGCAAGRDPAQVSMWAMSYEGENAPVLLPPFERATGLRVDLQSLPFTAAHEKILTAYAGNSLPDVLMVSNDWMPELVTIGALQPVPPGRRAGLVRHFPAMVRAVTFGETPFGQPWTAGAQAQFYRRDLLAAAGYPAPPPRRDEWTAMLRALKRRRPDGFALLMLLDWPEHLMTFAAQAGATPLRDRLSRGNFSSPAFRDALGYYKSLFDEALAPRVTIADIGDTISVFARGWVAVMPSGAFTVGDLAKRTGDVPRARWDVARMPGLHGPGAAPVGGNSLAVSAHARDPARAWQLVDYLTRLDTQLALTRLIGELPSRPAAFAAPALASDPVAQTFAAQMADPALGPAVLEWPRIQTEMQLVAERVARGEIGVAAAAAEMDRRADGLLAKRRWLLNKGLIA